MLFIMQPSSTHKPIFPVQVFNLSSELSFSVSYCPLSSSDSVGVGVTVILGIDYCSEDKSQLKSPSCFI